MVGLVPVDQLRKPPGNGGTSPQHILAVHRCLHRALAQAVTWRLLAHTVATDATPPPVPTTEVVALAPEQVALLLDAADRASSPWLGSWTVLAAATGARNGESCGLEWADLDLDAGTVRFHQALTIIDPAVLPSPTPDSGGQRKELAVGPVKSAASSAILALPPFAVQALRQHRRQQAQKRLACEQPQTVPPASRVAGVIEGMFGPAARGAQVVATVSAGRQVEGNRRETGASNPT